VIHEDRLAEEGGEAVVLVLRCLDGEATGGGVLVEDVLVTGKLNEGQPSKFLLTREEIARMRAYRYPSSVR
jgi:hypothetical protein